MVDASTARSTSGKNAASTSATRAAGVATSHPRARRYARMKRRAASVWSHSRSRPGSRRRTGRSPDPRQPRCGRHGRARAAGRRALLVYVVALTLAEGFVHLTDRRVDGVDAGEVDSGLVAGVLEHRERLSALIDEHALPRSLFQAKLGSDARPVRKNPSISLIWAKCTTGGARPRSSGPNPCEGADWQTCTVPATTPSMADLPAGATECRSREPFCGEEADRDRRDQGRVESREARELDPRAPCTSCHVCRALLRLARSHAGPAAQAAGARRG